MTVMIVVGGGKATMLMVMIGGGANNVLMVVASLNKVGDMLLRFAFSVELQEFDRLISRRRSNLLNLFVYNLEYMSEFWEGLRNDALMVLTKIPLKQNNTLIAPS